MLNLNALETIYTLWKALLKVWRKNKNAPQVRDQPSSVLVANCPGSEAQWKLFTPSLPGLTILAFIDADVWMFIFLTESHTFRRCSYKLGLAWLNFIGIFPAELNSFVSVLFFRLCYCVCVSTLICLQQCMCRSQRTTLLLLLVCVHTLTLLLCAHTNIAVVCTH